MATGIKDTLKDAGHKVVDTAKDLGQKIAEGAGQAKDWVKDKAGMCHTAKGAANMNDIKPHMDVISSCGCTMGKVDHMENGAIKLTKQNSVDGQHHFVPTQWVARVDEHVHLNKNADETRQGWKSDAAACSSCGA